MLLIKEQPMRYKKHTYYLLFFIGYIGALIIALFYFYAFDNS